MASKQATLCAFRMSGIFAPLPGQGLASARTALAGRALINGPEARCCQFEKMTVWIAEIDALTAARPIHAGLDLDFVLAKPPFPWAELIGANRESEMQRACAAMTGDRSAR